MELTEFLLARIAETEAAAKRIRPDQADALDGLLLNPHRTLAECEAKRRIVGIAQGMVDSITEGRPHRSFLAGRVHDGATILQALALPYAEHPDYQEKWRLSLSDEGCDSLSEPPVTGV